MHSVEFNSAKRAHYDILLGIEYRETPRLKPMLSKAKNE